MKLSRSGPARASAVALPREHGAWVMLICSLALGLVTGGTDYLALSAVVLVLAVFIAQETQRRTGWRSFATLAVVAIAGLAAASLALLRPSPLLWSALLAGALLALFYGGLAHRRRGSVAVQVLGVLGFALAVPLGAAAGSAPPFGTTWWLYANSALFYLGAVTNVRQTMAAAAAAQNRAPASPWRLPIVRWNHAVAAVVVAVAAGQLRLPGEQPLIAVGMLAGLARCTAGWAWLRHPPSLRRVGLWETAWTLWFTVWAALAAR